MKQTTLCYLEQDGCYLMLHRVRKAHDENHDKWIGVGGKFEDRESPEDCARREVLEETGLTLTDWRYCGLITFVSDRWETEYMHLFHATGFTGTLRECDEGVLSYSSGSSYSTYSPSPPASSFQASPVSPPALK